ncbi:MAG: hypothetical protein C5B54_03880 [Acidobacteria bacterium]|nr:MAG: hypothetical protein C5B54_03880 [Acidobacteriota bacterium]
MLTTERKVSNEMLIPFLLAAGQLILILAFHKNYGYFRDELYYIACSKHLAWGYVDQPPFSIALLELTRFLFGDSLLAIRFPTALAGSITVIFAALIARKMGGGRFAVGLASFSVVAAPVLIGTNRYYSMNALDVMFWALAAHTVVTILSDDSPRLWLRFGIIAGLGLLNKYSMGFFCIGLFTGLLLSSQRIQLATKWFWFGASIAFAIFLPHILWEVKYHFPTLEFMHNATQNKNVNLSLLEFAIGQLRDMNFLNAPVWMMGLFYFLFGREGSRYRPIGWMYVLIFILMVLTHAKVYYLSPIYPMMLAGGSVFAERLIREHSWNWVKPVYVTLLSLLFAISVPFTLPILSPEKFIAYMKFLGVAPHAEERSSLGALPQYYADQFGWEEIVKQVADSFQTLTPQEKAHCVIYVRNYGEAAAIDFFGKKYGLPNALCAHNSYWFWGPGKETGDIAIILGDSRDLQENLNDLKGAYSNVQLAFKTHCTYCMPFENDRSFFICRGMKTTFQKIWPHEKHFI